MNVELLTSLLMWCSVINGIVLFLWSSIFMLMPDTVYRLHNRWFSITKDNYDLLMYAFLGLYKILFLVFNLVPYISLKLVY